MIVCAMGNARVGKDTLAERLAQTRGFTRIGLADPIKRICQDVFDFTDAQVWGDEKEKPDKRYLRHTVKDKMTFTDVGAGISGEIEVEGKTTPKYLTPRYAMQRLGTEWGRDCFDSIWFDIGMRTAHKLLRGGWRYNGKEGLVAQWDSFGQHPGAPPPGVAFSDFRFRNEFYPAKEQGAILVRIIRPGFEGGVGIQGHQSEVEVDTIPLDQFNYVIKNDGTLEEYLTKIDTIFDELLGPRREVG